MKADKYCLLENSTEKGNNSSSFLILKIFPYEKATNPFRNPSRSLVKQKLQS